MIYVVGIGPGKESLLTRQAQELLIEADWILGTSRQLKAVATQNPNQEVYSDLYALLERLEGLKQEKTVVLASGDPLVYGIGTTLRHHFKAVEIVSGISSLHYMFTRIDQDMNEVFMTSAHGRVPDYGQWFKMPKLAAVTDNLYTPQVIAKAYNDAGIKAKMYVGTSLSYPEECIVVGSTDCIQNMSFKGLSVVVIVHEG